ncbi:hypothetical protein PGTUg99_002890 [Puccinia graminis f. sp. tritici]|uniref:BAR domain-containing protein n=1 Tax=Puccinia graminis f. sp. tritici TaxID=56615 RepID=A0A5B0S9Q0_PUCGR|nr:hypothetical protein PGTUg99_002890 [Puccinia graminis f. sp. tritici]
MIEDGQGDISKRAELNDVAESPADRSPLPGYGTCMSICRIRSVQGPGSWEICGDPHGWTSIHLSKPQHQKFKESNIKINMSWSGFKKTVNRAGTTLMQKTGQLEKTTDREFQEHENRFKTYDRAFNIVYFYLIFQ